jgi:L-ascorbate metabolism protein UlaG (beta-lactamase superfamily)
MVGPIRFTETPCAIEDLPEVDAVLISHDHYDHLDSATLAKLLARQPNVEFFCGLNLKAVLVGLGIGIKEDQVTEMDWWDRVVLKKEEVGEVELVCTPAQHKSGRSPFGAGAFWRTLWCSWVIKELSVNEKEEGKKLFFSGDTGYCVVNSDAQFSHESAPHPPCPAFRDVGELYGPFDLALLPIGCYSPRSFMSGVHSSPEDSLSIHKDIKSKRSIGMHYGTFRGNISAYYEPVTEPPERWRAAAEKEGLKWRSDGEQGWEIGVCGIGETVVV